SYEYTGSFDEGQFSDFFEEMFGSRFGEGRQTKFRGQDYHAVLQLSLESASKTHQQTFTVNGKNIRITGPVGIAHAQKIKLIGHGGEGVTGGPQVDLFITFHIHPHSQYTRIGDDLTTKVNIDLYTAVLGREINVQTLDSKIKAKTKAG